MGLALAEMVKDLSDDAGVLDRSEHPYRSVAGLAGREVKLEHTPQALGPGHRALWAGGLMVVVCVRLGAGAPVPATACRGDLCPQPARGCKQAVVARQIHSRPSH